MATKRIPRNEPNGTRVLFYGNGSGWGNKAVKAGAELVVEEQGGQRGLLRSLKDPIAKLRPLAGTAEPERKESGWLGLALLAPFQHVVLCKRLKNRRRRGESCGQIGTPDGSLVLGESISIGDQRELWPEKARQVMIDFACARTLV